MPQRVQALQRIRLFNEAGAQDPVPGPVLVDGPVRRVDG